MKNAVAGRFDPRLADKPYSDSFDYINDELKLMELRLTRLMSLTASSVTDDKLSRFKGLVVSRDEVSRLLLGEADFPSSSEEMGPTPGELARAESHIAQRAAVSLDRDVFLSPVYLKLVFELSDFEYSTLLLSLACELDMKFEKIFGYIQDNITLKYPTIALAIRLFSGSAGKSSDIIRSFEPGSILYQYFYSGVLNVGGDSSLLSTQLKLDRRILDFIINPQATDSEIDTYIKLFSPVEAVPELLTDAEILPGLSKLVESQGDIAGSNIIINIHGRSGAGKKLQVKHFAKKYQQYVILADISAISANSQDFKHIVNRLRRESVLMKAIICYCGFDALMDGSNETLEKTRMLFENNNTYSRITFVLSENAWRPELPPENHALVSIPIDAPDSVTRKFLWETFSRDYKLSDDVDLSGLAGKFHFTHNQIKNALRDASNISAMTGSGIIDAGILHESCYRQIVHNLQKRASPVKPIYEWDDLILPEEQKKILKNACNQIKLRHIVFGDWGFDNKLAYGKGLTMLFSGPPGTGKTMAAQVIARDLRLEMYKVQLSQVVSKYIGETEKNLKEIFEEARRSDVILFFDETDALFGKRSEVKDSHDRYANIETAFLLQEIEEHTGVTVMATNFMQNIDDAFLRRINFVVHFPFPDKTYRKKIWKAMFPENTPLDRDIDFDFLAERFELSGGNIKNIVVSAAFLAAQDKSAVNMRHIIDSLKYELGKNGKIVLREDLGEWA